MFPWLGNTDGRKMKNSRIAFFTFIVFLIAAPSAKAICPPSRQHSYLKNYEMQNFLEYRIPISPAEGEEEAKSGVQPETKPVNARNIRLEAVSVFNVILPSPGVYSAGKNLFVKEYEDTYPIRGLHLTSWIAGMSGSLDRLIALIRQSELNAMVVDLKEADGVVAYNSNLKTIRDLGTVEERISNLDKILTLLDANKIYSIARICVFKDTLLADAHPDLAVKDKKSGGVWHDKKGQAWMDPYNKKVWDYNLSIAIEAASRGFKEIQFDYVRFPSDGLISDCVYPARNSESDSRHYEVIRNFLAYARQKLSPYGVKISADVFGLTCSANDDMNIGQVIEQIAKEVDYVCPMVYPSHYYRGAYNLSDPESMPYTTVYTSMKDAMRKIASSLIGVI